MSDGARQWSDLGLIKWKLKCKTWNFCSCVLYCSSHQGCVRATNNTKTKPRAVPFQLHLFYNLFYVFFCFYLFYVLFLFPAPPCSLHPPPSPPPKRTHWRGNQSTVTTPKFWAISPPNYDSFNAHVMMWGFFWDQIFQYWYWDRYQDQTR